MKCIAAQRITAATATSAATDYPAANIYNGDSADPWRAGGRTATLTLTVAPGSSGIGLTGVIGTEMTLTVKDGDGEVVISKVVDLSGITDYYQWWTNTGTPRTVCALEYDYQMSEHTIEIAIDSGSDSVAAEIGEAMAGIVRSWPHAAQISRTEIEQGAIDDSYADGSPYYIEGVMVAQYSITVQLDLTDLFFSFVEGVSRNVKKHPTFWWLVDGNNIRWLTYCRITTHPSAPIGNRYGAVSLTLTEVFG